MTTFFNEDEQSTPEEAAETGKALRAKLEAALAENTKMKSKLTTYEVQEFLGGKQLDLVKPEDLAGVDPKKWEETATQIHTERQETQRTLLRAALATQGMDEETIEQLVAGVVPKPAETAEAKATERIRQVSRVASTPPPAVDPSKVHGFDAIRASFA